MDQTVFRYDADGCVSQQSRSGALAALTLLTSYNQLLAPPDVRGSLGGLLSALPPPCLAGCCRTHGPLSVPTAPLLSPGSCEGEVYRRRGEKRPIPAELKDEKYFERRRRNNQAAKKSRDARRMREDQIAWRACVLEQENASLRAHVAALRQEALALRALLAAQAPHASIAHTAHPVPPAPPHTQPAPTSTTSD
ncbi:CCAAT/enhancer-binding protein delta-like [Galleria mellonella]|uniref:CCAAT/enhancer-binding protein delta-like n=1 Tax=Galleria mellonella TaxID=7137 RepID=A0A6J3BYL9_GALME|nr:CCAAT/enhancer-binding protein delta-like [Galleria mellonella]XP_052757334.1 CCAAT/enhancer-binding protein delta-like [Galleria mellonella]